MKKYSKSYQTKRMKKWLSRGVNINSWDTFTELVKYQHNTCAICGISGKWTPLHLDHYKTNGRIRGLLCERCNRRAVSSVERWGKYKSKYHLTVILEYLANPPYERMKLKLPFFTYSEMVIDAVE
jgi:hypothetical protein